MFSPKALLHQGDGLVALGAGLLGVLALQPDAGAVPGDDETVGHLAMDDAAGALLRCNLVLRDDG